MPTGVGGTLRLVRYAARSDPDLIRWEGMLAYPGVGVWLESRGSREHTATVRDYVKSRASEWRPQVPPGRDSAELLVNAFRTAMGYFPPPAAQAEEVYVRLVDPAAGTQLEIKSQVVVAPAPQPFKPLAETLEAAELYKVSARGLREGPREAAGVLGVEQVAAIRDGASHKVVARWWFGGLPNNARYPSILISIELSGEDSERQLGTWDALLSSLRLPG